MKRGGLRTHRRYVEVEGEKVTLHEIQGRRNKLWIPVVEKNKETGKNEPLIFATKEEAEKKFKEILKDVQGKVRFRRK